MNKGVENPIQERVDNLSPFNVTVTRRGFLGLFLGSAVLAACGSPKPRWIDEKVIIDTELVDKYLDLIKEAEQTARTWLRPGFVAAHPLHLIPPLSIARDSNLRKLRNPMYDFQAAAATKEIEDALTERQQGRFSISFELEGTYWNQLRDPYNALEGKLTNIYAPDGHISANELLIKSIFDRHLMPNYDITKSVPEFANLVYLGKGDYEIESTGKDLQGFPTQVPFESLARLAGTLFNLPKELFAADTDKPNTFSTRFGKKQAVFARPGFFFNGSSIIHRKITRDNVSEWEGRYLTEQNRLVMIKTDSIGMVRLRMIEPFNTSFRVSQAERTFFWPEDK